MGCYMRGMNVSYGLILTGSDDAVLHLQLSGVWSLSVMSHTKIVHEV